MNPAAASSKRAAWALAGYGSSAVLAWDGRQWSVATRNPGERFFAIERADANSAWLAGNAIWRLRAGRLNKHNLGKDESVDVLGARSPTDAWALGRRGLGGALFAKRWNGRTWRKTSPPPGPPYTTYEDMASEPRGSMWAVGYDASRDAPLIAERSTSGWTRHDPPVDADGILLWGVAANTQGVWAVGGNLVLRLACPE